MENLPAHFQGIIGLHFVPALFIENTNKYGSSVNLRPYLMTLWTMAFGRFGMATTCFSIILPHDVSQVRNLCKLKNVYALCKCSILMCKHNKTFDLNLLYCNLHIIYCKWLLCMCFCFCFVYVFVYKYIRLLCNELVLSVWEKIWDPGLEICVCVKTLSETQGKYPFSLAHNDTIAFQHMWLTCILSKSISQT